MKKQTYLALKNKLDRIETLLNGGKGSGNFGHSGREGKVGGSSSRGTISGGYNRLLETDGPGSQQKVASELSYQTISEIEKAHPELIDKEKQERNLKSGYDEYKRWSDSSDRVQNLSYEEYKQKVLDREIDSDGRLLDKDSFHPIYSLALYGAGASPFLEGFLMYASGANIYHLDREGFDKSHKISETIDQNKDLWTDYDKPLYRGISTNEVGLEQLKKGATVSMNGVSSWSSEKDIADRFTKSGLIKTGNIPVVFIDKSKKHDKTVFYPFSSAMGFATQYEYLQSGSKKYKVNDIRREGDVYYADVESY